ncbi:hypothetical protein ACOJA0_03215 [Corynebacterium amycolatum]|uniref:hypothetical protein n=1 Tax=Corynebacterium amycolatum TaxID=43765 RepID=UPI003B5CA6FC
MSYADVVIERNSATVDDEYQQMLLHKSYTYGFTMMMWANYVLATVLIWLIPEPKMVGVTVANHLDAAGWTPVFAAVVATSSANAED